MGRISPGTGRSLIDVAAGAVVAAALLALGVLIGGGDLADAVDDLLIVLLTVAVVAALAGWARERRSAATRAALDERRRGEMADRARELESELRESERRVDELRREAHSEREAVLHERRLRVQTQRARKAEREWTRELREQVLSMYRNQGSTSDVRELIMQVAVQLSGAERGLLLAKRDSDGDGRLDVVCHMGFQRDPSDSAVAQRFARRVLERDEIVREDAPSDRRSDVDEEIDSLVAVPVFVHDGFEGVVVCANRPGGFEELDDAVLLALGDHAGAVLEHDRLHGRLRTTYLAVVGMLADAVEANDPFVHPHSAELSGYVDRVARGLELDSTRREGLQFATLLRDVGKLGISERVLQKPGELSREERAVVELHPVIGARIVERVPGLAALAPAIRHHHERWDGRGYPDGLRGDEIPIEARVIAVADCFCALTTNRPYHTPVTTPQACAEIERAAGTQLDPRVARLFVGELRRHPPEPSGNGALRLDASASAAPGEERPASIGAASAMASDGVTLLYAHRHLQEVAAREAGRAARHQRPFAVVMVELSELSEINRREGYAAGDAALRLAARALERAVAAEPATVGRYSGRRLAAVLPGKGHQAASAYGVRIQRALEEVGQRCRTGVAVWQHGDHGEDVFARARLAVGVTSIA
ncbi:MAG TPA: HD domain-containing phosphohydrolase [Thermoleophilaceae bacterium]|nr:HD domain-containing phosphohydrolase [Thermoleophilaceae bacterium]